MNVASLELCMELYELSGWRDIEYRYYNRGPSPRFGLAGDSGLPAYDLGYLLRKLPQYTRVFYGDKHKWYAEYDDFGGRSGRIEASDTPENATAKLAIELLKSGVLTSEHDAPKEVS